MEISRIRFEKTFEIKPSLKMGVEARTGNPSQDSSRTINIHQRYVFARANQSTNHLVDRGFNGGLAGADMRILQEIDRKINIVGIDDHELTGLDVMADAALFDAQKGPVIGIFHEHAHLGKGRSIHAAGQMEWFNCNVDDISKDVGFPRELKLLMDMCFHFPLNLVWIICTPSGSLLMMALSKSPCLLHIT